MTEAAHQEAADPPVDDPPPLSPRVDEVRQLLGLLTEADFAAAMRVEFRTAQMRRSTGKPYPPVIRFGRTILLQVDATREWLRQQAEGACLEVHRASPRRRG